MTLEWIQNETLSESVTSKMQIAADQCVIAEGVKVPCAATIRLCGDEEIAHINASTRGINSSTDVLSFPTILYPSGYTAGACETLLRREYDDELCACFLGDIIISVPHLISQAHEYGHSPEREAAYLLVHGLFHLMGYDHIDEEDRVKMRNMEEKVLSAVDITRDSVFSASDLSLVARAVEAMENSYSPYSHFPVGAALHCTDGRMFTGCNIENVSFGLTNCAERTAVFKAVSEGARSFDVIAIAANQTPWPCGACRQVLAEFAPNIRILLAHDGQIIEKNLSELLPYSIDLEVKETAE